MAGQINIRKSEGTWVVRAGGAVLGESANALVMSEDSLPPRIYFPREDIAMDFLDRSETSTNCPYKGEASYFSIVTNGTTINDAVWSYETPIDDVARIAGHLSFYESDQLTVEQL